MTKVNKSVKRKNSGIIVGLVFLVIVAAIAGLAYWNYENSRPYDDSVYTPVPIAEKDIVPVPRDVIIDLYKNNKETFDKVFAFLANNPTEYKIGANMVNGTRTAMIEPDIKDAEIKGLVNKIIVDLNFNSIFNTFSLSPDDMSVWMLYDGKEGSFQRGLVYFKKDESKGTYSTRANEVWDLQSLAPQTYFYYNHFDAVQHQDVFRDAAWKALQNDSKLTSEQKSSVTTKKEDAIIKITKVKDPKSGQEVNAISLTYSTSKAGYGNNIIVYLDGKTRATIKVTTAGEEMFGL